jgi:hypothetical protein
MCVWRETMLTDKRSRLVVLGSGVTRAGRVVVTPSLMLA